ncbi:DUF3168 domain-containing protein [Hymenobacter sp. HSC-4F20]|uniref:tail completion protein gp17 n=1 Tax=Hymenobacter sp. HSC-4F20 TaxID=2864135 RepID=UPI001C7380B5|nr:DUF3168 domain-containing protein [Hymenobacter sp. HSC-4F20]MBX0290112.1 DUF3168 domain-containing protein [Hymenobacter sp. HSC-4F20]
MLHDPQLPLQKSVFQALGGTPILIAGQAIPVFEFAPSGAIPPCILITQQTVKPQGNLAGCKTWECSLLLDIITSFQGKNQVSSRLANQIAEVILSRLENQRLTLEGGFDMSPAGLELSTMLTDNVSQDTVDVHRYLRFAFTVEQHQQTS